MIWPGFGAGVGGQLVVVFPRIADDTGTWPLHLLASAPVEELPGALRLLAARSCASEALPSPETLQVCDRAPPVALQLAWLSQLVAAIRRRAVPPPTQATLRRRRRRQS